MSSSVWFIVLVGVHGFIGMESRRQCGEIPSNEKFIVNLGPIVGKNKIAEVWGQGKTFKNFAGLLNLSHCTT